MLNGGCPVIDPDMLCGEMHDLRIDEAWGSTSSAPLSFQKGSLGRHITILRPTSAGTLQQEEVAFSGYLPDSIAGIRVAWVVQSTCDDCRQTKQLV